MGYRTKPFHRIMERAESSFRELLSIPDTHEVASRDLHYDSEAAFAMRWRCTSSTAAPHSSSLPFL